MKEAAIALVFGPIGQEVLLIKRADIPVWVLPGGGIDEGETPEEAVKREVWEESGLRVKVERLAAVLDPTTRLTSRIHLFDCTVEGGTLGTSEESIDARFFPLRDLPKSLFLLHQILIDTSLQNRDHTVREPLKVTWWISIRYLLSHPLWSLSYLWRRFVKIPISAIFR